jgi:hypothetical protein
MYDLILSYLPYALSILIFLLTTFVLGAVAVLWKARGLIGARVPWLGAMFEILDMLGFTPKTLAQWVTRRSWYLAARRSALDSLGDKEPPSALLPSLACVLLIGSMSNLGCASAALPEGMVCPLPDLRTATLPTAIKLSRYVLTLVSSSCGESCPAELATVRQSVDKTEATAADVCRAVEIAQLIPCEQCADRLDAVRALLACETP